MQSEAACGCETIERPAARIPRSRHVILALIQKDAGLLAVQQIRVQRQPVHLHRNHLRNHARHHPIRAEALRVSEPPHRSAPRCRAAQKALPNSSRSRLGAIHALIQSLHGEVVAIAIDHQARQLIAFAMHQAIGFRFRDHALAIGLGLRDAPQKKARSIVSLRSESIRNEIWDALL
jgi:hypothetical protein